MEQHRLLLHLDLPPRPELIVDALLMPDDEAVDGSGSAGCSDVNVALEPAEHGTWRVELAGPRGHVTQVANRLRVLQESWDAANW